ncbi:MAG TPA: ATP-binding protein, partial [Actinomycetota bacterium]
MPPGGKEGAASSRYLRQRLAVVEARVSAAVARRRTGDPDADDRFDRFRGLYISDADVDELLSDARRPSATPAPDEETASFLLRVEALADEAEAGGTDLRLRRLVRSFGLDDHDLELLLIALAPDLDPR